MSKLQNAAMAAVTGLAIFAGAVSAHAEVKDYEFQLVKNEIQRSGSAIVEVRLMNKKTNQAVPDAVIFATRIDMAPDGMEEMASRIEPLPSTQPGTYRFKANLAMEGRWRLSLGAKVQGETGTIESKLVLKAVQ